MASKKKKWPLIVAIIGGVLVFLCGGFFALGLWAQSDPHVQATTTARSIVKNTTTALAMINATGSAFPTVTTSETSVPTRTPAPSATSSETIDPLFTPPTNTSTSTNTVTPTPSQAPSLTPSPTKTNIPTNTPTRTKTPTPTRTATFTKTPTPTKGPTPIPTDAGMSDWMIQDGVYVGVRELSLDYYLGYFRAEQGKIYISLYIVVINTSNTETSVRDYDLSLIDGGGQVTSGVIFGHKEPEFSGCTLIPGGSCEGWWTTMIVDQPQIKSDLTLRWDPCLLFCDALEAYIRQ